MPLLRACISHGHLEVSEVQRSFLLESSAETSHMQCCKQLWRRQALASVMLVAQSQA